MRKESGLTGETRRLKKGRFLLQNVAALYGFFGPFPKTCLACSGTAFQDDSTSQTFLSTFTALGASLDHFSLSLKCPPIPRVPDPIQGLHLRALPRYGTGQHSPSNKEYFSTLRKTFFCLDKGVHLTFLSFWISFFSLPSLFLTLFSITVAPGFGSCPPLSRTERFRSREKPSPLRHQGRGCGTLPRIMRTNRGGCYHVFHFVRTPVSQLPTIHQLSVSVHKWLVHAWEEHTQNGLTMRHIAIGPTGSCANKACFLRNSPPFTYCA